MRQPPNVREQFRRGNAALIQIVALHDLAGRLANLLRRQSAERLDEWLDKAEMTPLACFTAGLRRDVEAVRGAIQMPWSTSPVEGHIGRLKMLKRTMYGRAGFALLRHRVLHAA